MREREKEIERETAGKRAVERRRGDTAEAEDNIDSQRVSLFLRASAMFKQRKRTP